MLIIRNGILVDGCGGNPYQADILIKDGVIAAIGALDTGLDAGIIDAAGKLVTPGFIDIHRHADHHVFQPGYGAIELHQGITTTINGNCGMSAAPMSPAFHTQAVDYLRPILGSPPPNAHWANFAEYLAAVETQKLPIHFGCCVGNGSLRVAATGFSDAPLTGNDKAHIRHQLENSLQAGAMGVTLGIAYVPEVYYDTATLTEVLAPMRGRNVPLCTHIRGEGDLLVPSLKEVITLAHNLEVPLHVSHLKAVGRQNWGVGLEQAMTMLNAARAEGLEITVDAYPYTAGSSLLSQFLPPWTMEGGVEHAMERLRSPATRLAITEELKQPQISYENILYSVGWDGVLLTGFSLPEDQCYVGRRVEEIARTEGVDPYEFVYDLLLRNSFNVSMVNFSMCEEDMIHVLCSPYSCVISDSVYSDSGMPHPRMYASFNEFLCRFVMEKRLMTIEQAIPLLTSRPADVFRLTGKGRLGIGYDADLCIFAPENLGNRATYSDPVHYAYGMDYVLVGGQMALAHDKLCHNSNGRILRQH